MESISKLFSGLQILELSIDSISTQNATDFINGSENDASNKKVTKVSEEIDQETLKKFMKTFEEIVKIQNKGLE